MNPLAPMRRARGAGRAVLAATLLAAGTLHAQTVAPPATVPSAAARDALIDEFGGRAGMAALMDRFVDRLYADPRIARHFEKTGRKFLKNQLTDQLCQVAGGACVYDGETMKKSHASLGVTRADFNALVENLQIAMDAQGIAFSAQNRLLARLAPMHRDIVTR